MNRWLLGLCPTVLGYLLLGVAVGAQAPIQVLSIGAVLAGDTPIIEILSPEPAVSQTLVPTRRASEMEPDTAKRYVRLYFPKTYDLLREHAFIIYVAAPDVRPLTTAQIQQLRRATEEGMPAFADQGGISGYTSFEEAWMVSGLHEIFPNDAVAVVEHGVEHSLDLSTFRISVQRDQILPAVLTPFVELGIERYVVSHGFYVVPKQGATIWAEMKGLFPEKGRFFPWLMSMEVGGGLTWNMGDNFVSSFWASRFGEMRNPYRTDVLMNVIYHSVGWQLPEDIILVHRQRQAFADYIQRRRFVLEVFEFAESFGAAISKLHDDVGRADFARDDAERRYLEQDYGGSEAMMAEAFSVLDDVNRDALRAKDRALLWVYMIEWLAVTATLLVSGLVLHSLMFRRRLYSESGRTSFF